MGPGRHATRSRSGRSTGPATAATPQVRTVNVYGALGFVASSRPVFFPQDGDAIGEHDVASRRFRLRPRRPSTGRSATRTATSSARSVAGRAAATPGPTRSPGTAGPTPAHSSRAARYRSVVTATDGTLAATQRVAVVADAFRVTATDATPARGQKITVTAITRRGASTSRRGSRVYQPGIGNWAVAMTKRSIRNVPGHHHRSSRAAAAPLRLRVAADDARARASPRACTCRSTDRRAPGGNRRGPHLTGRDRTGPVPTAPHPCVPVPTGTIRPMGRTGLPGPRVTVLPERPRDASGLAGRGPRPRSGGRAGMSLSRGCRRDRDSRRPRRLLPHARRRRALGVALVAGILAVPVAAVPAPVEPQPAATRRSARRRGGDGHPAPSIAYEAMAPRGRRDRVRARRPRHASGSRRAP